MSSIQNILGLLFCLVIPAGIFGITVSYQISKYENGAEITDRFIARRIAWVLVLFLVVILLGVLITKLSAEWIISILLLIFAAGLIVSLIVLRINRSRIRSGDLLLDLGFIESKVFIFSGVLFLITGASLTSEALSKQSYTLEGISKSIFWLSASLYWLTIGLSKVNVTTRGISRFYGFIHWHQIQNYTWAKDSNRTLVLTISKLNSEFLRIGKNRPQSLSNVFSRIRLPIFEECSQITWLIPSNRVEKLTEVLSLYVEKGTVTEKLSEEQT